MIEAKRFQNAIRVAGYGEFGLLLRLDRWHDVEVCGERRFRGARDEIVGQSVGCKCYRIY